MKAPEILAQSPRSDISDPEWSARCELAALYRVADMYGWTDLLSTHISLRVPGEEEHFLINPFGLLFEEVTASNLVKVDESGAIVGKSDYPINPAGFVIHGCIHKARPDVNCVIHLHSQNGVAVATRKSGLLPVTQHALVIWDHLAYHDFEGPALDRAEEERLVRDLGDKRMLILRNHGTLTAGRTVGEAFVLMYRLERACRIQVAAAGGGEELNALPADVVEKSIGCGKSIFSKGGFSPDGKLEWAACRRRLDRLDSGYAV